MSEIKLSAGWKIKKYRKLKGLTQKELGLLYGFSEKTAEVRIAQYEKGARNPNDKTLKKLAEILEVDPVRLQGLNIESEDLAGELLLDIINQYGRKFVETCLQNVETKAGKTSELKESFVEEMFIKELEADIVTICFGSGAKLQVVPLEKVIQTIKKGY